MRRCDKGCLPGYLCCLGCCLGTSGPTEQVVRDNMLRYAGIPSEDLLYFSHDNTALAALPYIIALDRCMAPALLPCLCKHCGVMLSLCLEPQCLEP